MKLAAMQMEAAIIGGDSRQLAVAEALADNGFIVAVFGHPEADLSGKVVGCQDLAAALVRARVVILPISGMNDAGLARGCQAEQVIEFGKYFASLTEGTLLLAGSLTPQWVGRAADLKIRVYQYAEDDAIAIPNAVPTAEGALQLAMEKLPVTIHDLRTVVVGFGRVGIAVAGTFKALGARVAVAARRDESLARAREMGCEAVALRSLAGVFPEVGLVVNTVPAPVINRGLLSLLPAEALVIDLAAAPGGTDFEAAKELKRNAILAPGLPGKVAPKTAGAILASAIPEIVAKMLSEGGGR